MSTPNTVKQEDTPPLPGESATHRAARVGDHETIRRLAAEGADLNLTCNTQPRPNGDAWPVTPLMLAAVSTEGASTETVTVLLDLGADPHAMRGGETAASFLCTWLNGFYWLGDTDRLRCLLDAGSPLKLTGDKGNRRICHAARVGDLELLRLLLDHGGDPKGYYDPEEAREQERRLQMKRPEEPPDEFLASMPPHIRDSMAETGRKLAEEAIERAGAGPCSVLVPLFNAVESGSLDCVRLLLDRGADVQVRDDCRRTALWYAKDEAMLRLLLELGLDLEARDCYEWTPLDDAVEDGPGALARIKALIALGANVNDRHDRGWTIFMSAASAVDRDRAVMETLVDAGADPHAVTELGYNAFHAAVDVDFEANREESVRMTLGYLKELGVDINPRNRSGFSPLARALWEGTGTTVRVLIELGADINAVGPAHICCGGRCQQEQIPLIFAAISAAVYADEKLEAMLQAGASLDTRDEEGLSPIEHAKKKLAWVEAERRKGHGREEWLRAPRRCVALLQVEMEREQP